MNIGVSKLFLFHRWRDLFYPIEQALDSDDPHERGVIVQSAQIDSRHGYLEYTLINPPKVSV